MYVMLLLGFRKIYTWLKKNLDNKELFILLLNLVYQINFEISWFDSLSNLDLK